MSWRMGAQAQRLLLPVYPPWCRRCRRPPLADAAAEHRGGGRRQCLSRPAKAATGRAARRSQRCPGQWGGGGPRRPSTRRLRPAAACRRVWGTRGKGGGPWGARRGIDICGRHAGERVLLGSDGRLASSTSRAAGVWGGRHRSASATPAPMCGGTISGQRVGLRGGTRSPPSASGPNLRGGDANACAVAHGWRHRAHPPAGECGASAAGRAGGRRRNARDEGATLGQFAALAGVKGGGLTKSAFLPLEARFRRWGRGAGRRVKEVGYGGGGWESRAGDANCGAEGPFSCYVSRRDIRTVGEVE